MRMPVCSYFIVVGSVLAGLLFWVSDAIEPKNAPLKISQTVGVPKPFAAQPEPSPGVTAVNFAAEHERPQTSPVKTVDGKRKQKATSKYLPQRTWFAEFPHDRMSIR